ncbi:hypothetical protein GCM10010171_38410 [Actinokineospora fastidiosa]|uniref:Uncharacterized protein n=1 Tax=Actinokineospora fastidiosa TaxID=1816 RepID=A0A918LFL8_9PSEU|nr:hypothetical protein GCM10010171_38410 [Actinokineospora fastidiosa]
MEHGEQIGERTRQRGIVHPPQLGFDVDVPEADIEKLLTRQLAVDEDTSLGVHHQRHRHGNRDPARGKQRANSRKQVRIPLGGGSTSSQTSLLDTEAGQTTLPDTAVRQASLPGNVTGQATLPDNVTRQTALPGNVTRQANLPDNVIRQATLLDNVTGQAALPGNAVAQGALRSDAAGRSALGSDAAG